MQQQDSFLDTMYSGISGAEPTNNQKKIEEAINVLTKGKTASIFFGTPCFQNMEGVEGSLRSKYPNYTFFLEETNSGHRLSVGLIDVK